MHTRSYPMYLCLYTYMFVDNIHIYIYTYTYIYVCIWNTCLHMRPHKYIYIYIYVYMYIYIHIGINKKCMYAHVYANNQYLSLFFIYVNMCKYILHRYAQYVSTSECCAHLYLYYKLHMCI